MAITKQQQPTTPNQANADLLYLLTSTNINKPQFQYVMEVGGLTLKQQPNPSGRGVFNIGQITRDLVQQDNLWKTPNVQTTTYTGKTITPVFYEEYGTSLSSSVSYYNGTSGSALYIMNGVVQPNDGSFNFGYTSYYTASFTPNNASEVYAFNHGLSLAPLTQSIRDTEYATFSMLNGNFNGNEFYAQDVYFIMVNVYNAAGANIQNFYSFNVDSASYNGGPRTTILQYYNDVYGSLTDGDKLLYLGAGPKNFDLDGHTLNSNWASYNISVWGQEGPGVESNTGQYASYRFEKQEPECDYEGTRFAFVNSLGVYDYFTFPFANSKQDSIERQTYEQGFVNYSTTGASVTYDKSRRGTKIFSIKADETRTAESDYLTQEQADWLIDLIESPEVYIQEGDDFLPIVIQNATYDYKTNPRTQKLYRLTITYKLANQKRGR